MTPADLSRPGWVSYLPVESGSRCVVNGVTREAGEITGMVVRASHVAGDDLAHIEPDQRSFVAAEMSAFLIHWMSVLECPVLNRPSARCLGGPGWYPEQWMLGAATVGLAARPICRAVGTAGRPDNNWPNRATTDLELVIVGPTCIGEAAPELRRKAGALARLAKLDFARFRFDGDGPDACLLEADPFPPLEDARIERALLATLARR